MSINAVIQNSMPIMPMKTTFTAENLNEGTPLAVVNEAGRYDTVEFSISAKETSKAAKPPEMTQTPLAKADLSHLEGKWVVTLYADGRIDDPIADYNRSQGNYFGDVWRAAMAMPSGKDIYQNAMESGLSEEQAWEQQKQMTTAHFRNHLDEALAVANKFSPRNTEADGREVEYADVYDKNGALKVPAKISPQAYQKKLQNIVESMMLHIKENQEEYPNLYQTHFGKRT